MPQSDTQAFKHYEIAAKLDCPYGLNRLASCYKNGQGIAIDYTKAQFYYRKAFEKGDLEIGYLLGYYPRETERRLGTKTASSEALSILEKTEEQLQASDYSAERISTLMGRIAYEKANLIILPNRNSCITFEGTEILDQSFTPENVPYLLREWGKALSLGDAKTQIHAALTLGSIYQNLKNWAHDQYLCKSKGKL